MANEMQAHLFWSTDVFKIVLSQLSCEDLSRLWLTGLKRLQRRMTAPGIVPNFEIILSDECYVAVWPSIVSRFLHLRHFSLIHYIDPQYEPIRTSELRKLPQNLESMTLHFFNCLSVLKGVFAINIDHFPHLTALDIHIGREPLSKKQAQALKWPSSLLSLKIVSVPLTRSIVFMSTLPPHLTRLHAPIFSIPSDSPPFPQSITDLQFNCEHPRNFISLLPPNLLSLNVNRPDTIPIDLSEVEGYCIVGLSEEPWHQLPKSLTQLIFNVNLELFPSVGALFASLPKSLKYLSFPCQPSPRSIKPSDLALLPPNLKSLEGIMFMNLSDEMKAALPLDTKITSQGYQSHFGWQQSPQKELKKRWWEGTLERIRMQRAMVWHQLHEGKKSSATSRCIICTSSHQDEGD
jgi:hypothetical protein